LISSSRAWPSGGLHHRELRLDALEPHHAVHPLPLDLPLALWLESELDEERRRCREIVDHDAHVIHALDRHASTVAVRGVVTNAGHAQFRAAQ
jgi:hypothetical protein